MLLKVTIPCWVFPGGPIQSLHEPLAGVFLSSLQPLPCDGGKAPDAYWRLVRHVHSGVTTDLRRGYLLNENSKQEEVQNNDLNAKAFKVCSFYQN